MKKSGIILLTFLLTTTSAFAKRFTNQYCEFELPPGWECNLEGAEYICQSVNADRKKEAIIILAAKVRGGQDSLDQYELYLKGAKTFSLPGGKVQVSEPKSTKMTKVNDQQWVESLHLASEVPGFYTRYLATVKEDLGVAVTFSVGKDYYSSYQSLFDKIIASLRVFRQAGSAPATAFKPKEANLLDNDFIPDIDQQFDIEAQGKRRPASTNAAASSILVIVIALAVGALVVYKKRKNKKKKQVQIVQ